MAPADQFIDVVVSAVRQLTPRVKEFQLVSASGDRLSAYAPGAHIEMRLPIAGALSTVRHYSLIGARAPEDGPVGVYRIAVQQQHSGNGGSQYLCSEVQVGSKLSISHPRNDFPLVESTDYAFFAGGIGITPIYSMVEALRRRGARFQLFFCARDRENAPYYEEIAEIAPESTAFFFGGRNGPNPLRLERVLPQLRTGTKIYVCGSAAFTDAVASAAKSMGVDGHHVHCEAFNPAASIFGSPVMTVRCCRSGLEFEVPPELSILDAFQAAGGEAIFDCRRGECGLCVTGVIGATAEIDHRDAFLSDAQKLHAKSMCICVSRLKEPGHLDLDL